MTRHAGDEEHLVRAAKAVMGEGVLAAGIFSWAQLIEGQALGGMAGGLAGSTADVAAGSVVADIAAVAGARAGAEAMASAHGMTVPLLVGVSAETIGVYNWVDDRAGECIGLFDRATTEVHVSKMGLSRVLRLKDPTTGDELGLHGSVASFSKQSGPDKLVMHLLTEA